MIKERMEGNPSWKQIQWLLISVISIVWKLYLSFNLVLEFHGYMQDQD